MKPEGRFKTLFRPFHKGFTRAREAPGLFGEPVREWRTVNRQLTDGVIRSGMTGRETIGFFSSVWMGIIGIDIDDHAHQGPGYILSVYETILSRFHGVIPSILCRSTSGTGLHAYWFLYHRVPEGVLIPAVKSRLEGIKNIDMRPTSLTSLRVPVDGQLIDPVTFKPLPLSIGEALKNPTVYHEAEILDDTTMPGFLRSRVTDRKEKFRYLRASEKMARAEARHAPIMPGLTNPALTGLVPIYRQAGMTIDEAVGRFSSLLSPTYQGELRNRGRLRNRVKGYWRKDLTHAPRYITPSLFNESTAREVSKLWPRREGQAFGRWMQERKTLTRILTGLYNWMDYIDSVLSSPPDRATWAYLYPYFLKNTREGFYPIPKTLFYSFTGNQVKFKNWLEASGILIKAPYRYSTEAGICLYYRISRPVGAVYTSPVENQKAESPEKST